MSHRALVRLAIGALTVVPAVGALPGTALAASAPSTPQRTATHTATTTDTAPPGSAEAYAFLIDPLAAVGHTTATAGGSSSSATGNAVELGGKPLIDGTTGGTQTGAGSKHGALLDTGTTPLGQLQVTPWSASVTSSDSGSTADSDAALLRLFVLDPKILRVAILQSHSHAESNSSGSSSSSSSDGAEVNAGDGALDVHVLHAESSSKSGGSSYLVGINGNEIGTSDQANGSCALSVPDVASLSCLSATGGTSGKQAGSSVGDATLGSGQAGGTVSGTKASGRSATLGGGSTQTTAQSGSAANASSGGSSLPFTGMTLPPFLAASAFLVAAGAWLQQAGRRFRRVGARVS